MRAEDFAGSEPRFVLEEFFAGRTQAWGIFQDRLGRVRRQFAVDIDGTWDGRTLTLVEDFTYSDGETEQRVWHVRKLDDHRYEGEADGVVGIATGLSYGNALNWRYDFELRVGRRRFRVQFDDWMLLQTGGVMINRATVRKWGLTIGEATIFFSPFRRGRSDWSDEDESGAYGIAAQ